jgi:hypothetical protein
MYEYIADRGESDKALAWLEWLESTATQSKRSRYFDWRDSITATRASHYALWNRAPAFAAATLSLFGDKRWVSSYPEWKMATALIKLSHGDRRGAKRALKSARHVIAPWLDRSGSMQMKAEWLDIVEQRINDASSPAPSFVPTSAD